MERYDNFKNYKTMLNTELETYSIHSDYKKCTKLMLIFILYCKVCNTLDISGYRL